MINSDQTVTVVAKNGDVILLGGINAPGDIILIPANEKHMTVNTGSEPLVLVCFFPVPDVSSGTQEFASFEA